MGYTSYLILSELYVMLGPAKICLKVEGWLSRINVAVWNLAKQLMLFLLDKVKFSN